MAPSPASPPAALALDLDGTLLDPHGRLPEACVAPLRAVAEAGIPVVLATGRMTPAVEPFWRRLGLTTPVVAYNGAMVGVPGDPPLHDARLAAPLATEALRLAGERGWHLNLYIGDRLRVVEEGPAAQWYARHFRVPLERLAREAVGREAATKLLLIVEEEELDAAHEATRERFGERAAITTSSRRFVEILPPGTDKGRALARLAEVFSIPLERWIAVGDGRNDLEMLRAAGCGLAVESAPPLLQDAADGILPPLYAGGLERLLAGYLPRLDSRPLA